MKLIGSLTSPYVRKVRIVMAEKKLDYEFVSEDVWSAATTIAESNPLGKVPCLVMEGAEALFDSRVIVEYLDALSPVGKLIPSVGREQAGVKTWEALADGVLDAAILARLEATWAGRSTEQRSSAWIDRQLGKVRAAVQAMSTGLGEQAFVPACICRCPTSASASPWDTWIFASPRSTGATRIRICTSCLIN